MDDNQVPKSVTEVRFSGTHFRILLAQILFVAIAIGIRTGSWWWGGGSLFGLCMALLVERATPLLMLLLSVGWGVIGYKIGASFDSDNMRYILAIVGFLVGLGVNLIGAEGDPSIGQERP